MILCHQNIVLAIDCPLSFMYVQRRPVVPFTFVVFKPTGHEVLAYDEDPHGELEKRSS